MARTVKDALRSKDLVRVFGLGHFYQPRFLELLGLLGGFDAVWLDLEHAGLTIHQVEEAVRAARVGNLDLFVRLNATDYATTMRVLEAGASGMMISMVRQLDQVKDLVRWTKFHPLGERGLNGTGTDGRFGTLSFKDYFRQANDHSLLGVQIEHIDAVQIIQQICSVQAIDFLFIGPSDLSQSLGIPGEWNHPDLWQAIETVARASAQSSIPWGILPLNPEFARRCVDLGCQILGLGIDAWILQRGIHSFKEDYRDFFVKR